MEELIAVVNENDEVVETKPISEVHKLGLIHREAYVYLINQNNEILLQKRKDNGLWDHSAAGHLSKNESYLQGAKREFEEELGIQIKINELKEIGYEKLTTIKPNKKNIRFVKIYFIKRDSNLSEFKIDNNELVEIKFFNKTEMQKLLQQPHLLTGSSKILIKKYILNLI